MHKNLFVVEGPEGSYKSTVVHKVADMLNAHGVCAMHSREPGGVEVAEKIRNIVVSDDMHETTEVLLFLAARTEHYHKVIKPNLYDGKVVVLDRFMYSSLSIQGAARGYDLDTIGHLHNMMLPDDLRFKTFYININPMASIGRKKNDEVQKFEKEEMDFHIKAHNYMVRCCDDPTKDVIAVSGYQDSTAIAKEIFNHIIRFI